MCLFISNIFSHLQGVRVAACSVAIQRRHPFPSMFGRGFLFFFFVWANKEVFPPSRRFPYFFCGPVCEARACSSARRCSALHFRIGSARFSPFYYSRPFKYSLFKPFFFGCQRISSAESRLRHVTVFADWLLTPHLYITMDRSLGFIFMSILLANDLRYDRPASFFNDFCRHDIDQQ